MRVTNKNVSTAPCCSRIIYDILNIDIVVLRESGPLRYDERGFPQLSVLFFQGLNHLVYSDFMLAHSLTPDDNRVGWGK
jgi:hypothetical protein